MTESTNRVITAPVRVAFPNLFVARAAPGATRELFGLTMLFPPDYDLAPIKQAIKIAAIAKWGEVPKGLKIPLRKAEEKSQYAGYEVGWSFANATSQYQPGVVDEATTPVTNPDKVFPGCWVRCYVNVYAWQHPTGGRGVSFGLNAVQYVRADERLDGRVSAVDVFEPIDFDDASVSSASDNDDDDDDDIFG